MKTIKPCGSKTGALRAELGKAWPYDNGHFDDPTRPSINAPQILDWKISDFVIIIVMVALLAIESMLSKTALLTPMPRWIVWGMTVSALLVSAWLLKISWNVITDRSVIKAFFISLAVMSAVAIYFALAAPRIANHWVFAFSDAEWGTAWYKITDADCGCGRRSKFKAASVKISTYGGTPEDIAIPNDQFDDLVGETRSMCIAVKQRQSSSGAMQIAGVGNHRLGKVPPVSIRPCADVIEPAPAA